MKAVVFKGPLEVSVEEVPDPKIKAPNDAIVKITSTAICGSDLHMYRGRTNAQPGMIFGHEPMGVVEEIGEGVTGVKRGDRVVMPFNVACGFCSQCVNGFPNACLTMNPHQPGAAYGYASMGPHDGGQAEYLRVPFADFNCLKLPGEPGDELETDFVLLADIFPTGYHGAELAGVQPGSSVAVFGAGPVGLMAAYSALLRGAAEVYVVDKVKERLQKAESIGAIPIDFTEGDPVEQIYEKRRRLAGDAGSLRPGGEKLVGVTCGIDAVGYEAESVENPEEERPTQALESLIRVTNATGQLGIIGVYTTGDPRGADSHAQKGKFLLPFGELWEKGIRLGTGQAPVKRYNDVLRDLIIAGRVKPSFVVSQVLPLSEAPRAYKKFNERAEGFTKVVLRP